MAAGDHEKVGPARTSPRRRTAGTRRRLRRRRKCLAAGLLSPLMRARACSRHAGVRGRCCRVRCAKDPYRESAEQAVRDQACSNALHLGTRPAQCLYVRPASAHMLMLHKCRQPVGQTGTASNASRIQCGKTRSGTATGRALSTRDATGERRSEGGRTCRTALPWSYQHNCKGKATSLTVVVRRASHMICDAEFTDRAADAQGCANEYGARYLQISCADRASGL